MPPAPPTSPMPYDPRCTCLPGNYAKDCPVGDEHGNHATSPVDAGQWPIVDSFSGKFRFLSNFWPYERDAQVGPEIQVAYDGRLYPTSEHAFVAAKTLDPDLRAWATAVSHPGSARTRGQQVPLRPDWDAVKVAIMWSIVMDKFCRNPDLRRALLSTGTTSLFEGNTWGDRFWGVVNGEGRNELGKVLMSVRSFLSGEVQ